MPEQFWIYNPKDLIMPEKFPLLFPVSGMTSAEICNSLTRLLLLLIIIALLTGGYVIAIVMFVYLIVITLYYLYQDKNGKTCVKMHCVVYKNKKNNKKHVNKSPKPKFIPMSSDALDEELHTNNNMQLDPRMFSSVDINTLEPDPIIKSNIPLKRQEFAHWITNDLEPSTPIY